MLLYRLAPDLRNRDARRDIGNPYEMHSTLCRAFSTSDTPCPPGIFLWRLEPESSLRGTPQLLVQAKHPADWRALQAMGWLVQSPAPPLDLERKLVCIREGTTCRFRLRANPSVCRDGKRQALRRTEEQLTWLHRQAERFGFHAPEVAITQEQMLQGRQRNASACLRVYSVLFDGMLRVGDAEKFRGGLRDGIGHGKALGLGLLSAVPVS